MLIILGMWMIDGPSLVFALTQKVILLNGKVKNRVWLTDLVTRLNTKLLAQTMCELLWLKGLLHEFIIACPSPINMFCDN